LALEMSANRQVTVGRRWGQLKPSQWGQMSPSFSVELARGSDARSRALATRIITAQSAEIRQMEDWYQRWYGRQLKVASSSGQMSGMHHSAG